METNNDTKAAPLTLRPFEQFDWHGYAGCETKTPEICNTDQGDLILDGSTVQFVANALETEETSCWSADFQNPEVARAVAEAILRSPEGPLKATLKCLPRIM